LKFNAAGVSKIKQNIHRNWKFFPVSIPCMLERDLALNPFSKQNMLRVDSWTSNLVCLYSIGKDMRRLNAKDNFEGRGEIPQSQEGYHHYMEASRPRQQKSK
jgi:hypothetical protein